MLKVSKILGVINVISIFIITSTLFSALLANDGGSIFALALVGIAFVFVSVVLTLPFLVILKKKGYKDNKFYILSHLILCGSSVLILLVALTQQ